MTQIRTSKCAILADHGLENPAHGHWAEHHDFRVPKAWLDEAMGQNLTSGFCTERAYPIQVNLEYRLAGELECAPGTTVSISSKRILFKPKHPIPTGSKIEAFVVWPLHPDSTIDLRLHIQGETLGNEEGNAAISIYRYRFQILNPNRSGRIRGITRRQSASG